MADEILQRDENHVTIAGAITDDANQEVRNWQINDTTKRLKVSATFPGNNDGQIKVSSDDTTVNYLENKLVAGTNITLVVNNPGGNETITINAGATTAYSTIQEDGTPITQQTTMNFRNGFDVVNDGAGSRTNIDVDESELDLSLMGGLLNLATQTSGQINLATQVTGLLSGANIDQSTLNFSQIGGTVNLTTQSTGTINLATQVTGNLSGSNIDESTLVLSLMGGQINLATQVSGILPLVNGGTNTAMVDPNADAFVFWDDGVSGTGRDMVFARLGTGLSFDGTNVNIDGSSIEIPATTVAVSQTAHGFSVGDVIRASSVAGTFTKAQADSLANAKVVGIVDSVAGANNFSYISHGEVNTAPSGTRGDIVYLDPDTAGAMTTTKPTVAGDVIKPIGVLYTSTSKMILINHMVTDDDGAIGGGVNIGTVGGSLINGPLIPYFVSPSGSYDGYQPHFISSSQNATEHLFWNRPQALTIDDKQVFKGPYVVWGVNGAGDSIVRTRAGLHRITEDLLQFNDNLAYGVLFRTSFSTGVGEIGIGFCTQGTTTTEDVIDKKIDSATETARMILIGKASSSNTLYSYVGNDAGSAGTATNIGTIVDGDPLDIAILVYPAIGEAEFWVNGTLQHTQTTNVPTGAATVGFNIQFTLDTDAIRIFKAPVFNIEI